MFQFLCFAKSCFIMCEQNCYFCSFLLQLKRCPLLNQEFCHLSVFFCLLCHVKGKQGAKTGPHPEVRSRLTYVLLAAQHSGCGGPPESTLFDSQQLLSFCACVPTFLTKIISSLKTPTTNPLNGDSQSHWRRKPCYAGSSFSLGLTL